MDAELLRVTQAAAEALQGPRWVEIAQLAVSGGGRFAILVGLKRMGEAGPRRAREIDERAGAFRKQGEAADRRGARTPGRSLGRAAPPHRLTPPNPPPGGVTPGPTGYGWPRAQPSGALSKVALGDSFPLHTSLEGVFTAVTLSLPPRIALATPPAQWDEPTEPPRPRLGGGVRVEGHTAPPPKTGQEATTKGPGSHLPGLRPRAAYRPQYAPAPLREPVTPR